MYLKRFEQHQNKTALIWRDQKYSYRDLLSLIEDAKVFFKKHNILPGMVVALEADFSPQLVAMFFALFDQKAIIVPMSGFVAKNVVEFINIAEVEKRIIIDQDEHVSVQETHVKSSHPLIQKLQRGQKAGLIFFSSGSSGKSKAIIHDVDKILSKFKNPKPAKTTIIFLRFDHAGGINTLLHILLNGGCMVSVNDLNP
ncbi:MAG: AMP-binding protein, partial [Pseudomonadota bacterium]